MKFPGRLSSFLNAEVAFIFYSGDGGGGVLRLFSSLGNTTYKANISKSVKIG